MLSVNLSLRRPLPRGIGRVRVASWGTALLAALSLCACLSAVGALAATRVGDEQPKDGRYYESLAVKAYHEKNYQSFLDNIKLAATLRPHHPRLMYYMAVGCALTGRGDEALLWLDRVARMGLVFPAETDGDFDSLKDSGAFKSLLEKCRLNKAPVVKSVPAFTLHEKGIVPESVAYDPVAQTFYLSSVYRRKIVRVGADGSATDFATAREGLWSVLGMKVDAARRLLWVCTAAQPQMSDYREEENGTSGIFKFDLRTGRLLKKYMLPNRPAPHLLGDLVVNSRGDVYASDSISPAIYVIRHEPDELELLVAGEPFDSPQGLDLTPDEKRLFVADYSKGIFLLDLKTGKVSGLVPAPDSAMLGIDGLYFHRGSLIGVQNGVNPQRLVRLHLSKDLNRVEQFEILEANNPLFDEPTLGVLVKGQLYFIANSQWGTIDAQGRLAADDKLRAPLVLKMKL